MTRGAFHRQGPFIGSGGRYSPGPATHARAFGAMRGPLDDVLTPPWVLARSDSVLSEATRVHDSPFRASAHPRRLTVGSRGVLDPRSLAPAALFGARLTSFFETRRRLSTSATAYDVRARTSSSHDPRRDGRRDVLPFLTTHASFLAEAVSRGELRRVHSRGSRCRFLLAFTKFSRPRYHLERATSGGLPRRIHSWRMTCTGPRTERRTCRRPGRETHKASRRPVHTRSNRACGQRSLPAAILGTSDVIGRAAGRGGDPLPTDGPTKVFVPTQSREGLRHPDDRDAFHRREREANEEDCSTPLLRVGLPLTPPTPDPRREEVRSWGIASAVRARSPASTAFERRAPFEPAGMLAPGTDDPSAPAWLGRARPFRRLVAFAGSCSARSA